MKNYLKLSIILTVILAVVVVWTGFAQQKSDETAVDPICRMSVKKAEAKFTADYKGTTYYFCAEGCKAAFLKNPEKYLQSKDQAGCAGQAGPHMKMMAKGKTAGCCAGGGCRMMRCRAAMAGCGKMMKCRGAVSGAPAAGQPMAHGGPKCCPMMMGHGMPMRHAGMMKGSEAGSDPSMLQAVELAVENTKDGVTVKFTSKNAESVKKIQEMWAKRLQMRKDMAGKVSGSHKCGDCPQGPGKAEAPAKPEAPKVPEPPKR